MMTLDEVRRELRGLIDSLDKYLADRYGQEPNRG